MVGAASEESVMLGYCCPNGSICDSLVVSFSLVVKEFKCFTIVWRRVFSKLSSNSMRFVLRHENKNVLLLCNFAR